MSISAVNCTPIKPQVSFKANSREDKHTEETAKRRAIITAEDLKDPVPIIASLATLAGVAYGGAKGSAVGVSKLYNSIAETINKNVVKKAGEGADVAKKLTPEIGELLEKGLRKASSLGDDAVNFVRKGIADDATDLTKSQKVRKFIGDKMAAGIDLAKKGYKKIAYFNVADDVTGAARTQAGFENIAGAVGLASIVPSVMHRDDNNDGIKDILQKSQIAYTAREDKLNEDIGAIGNVVQEVVTNLA